MTDPHPSEVLCQNTHILPATVAKVTEPISAYLRPILEIHRGPDAYVTFHRKVDDRFEDLGAVRTAELATIFPELISELERDSYFSINSFYRARRTQTRFGLPVPYRKSDGVRYLNACFCDIDCHKRDGFDFGQHFANVISMQDQRVIPPASFVVRSGRGMWLLWLLTTSDNLHIPPRAFPERVILYRAIQSELIRRTSADEVASDVARITRVPGSINSAVSSGWPNRVLYWPQPGANGKGYVYTLESLASLLGLDKPQTRAISRPQRSESETISNRALRGWHALWDKRFQDFEALRAIRGQFVQGCRNNAAYIYGVILRANRLDERTVRQELYKLGRECSPPLSQSEIDGAVLQSKKNGRRIRDSVIAKYLKVAPEEAQHIPRWRQHPTTQAAITDISLRPQQRMELRKEAILKIVASRSGRIPSLREMAALLGERGMPISHTQVSNYYRELQLKHLRENASYPVNNFTLVGGSSGDSECALD